MFRVTPEARTAPLLPSYGSRTLAELGSSILAALGGSGVNTLGLPPSRKICLLIVDGLGWGLLRDHPAAAPLLNELAMNPQPLAAGFPATTVTSLTSLGTGSAPGQHGVLGYQVRIPDEHRLLNGLRWDDRIDPETWQPRRPIYQRAVAAGIAAYYVAPRAFRRSGLTRAAMRGAEYRPADSMGALAGEAGNALREADEALVTVYHGDLDGTGHGLGVASDSWYYQLAHVDKLAEQIAGALPSDSALYVTADHGMVDVPAEDRVDVDDPPDLRAGVTLLGGEPRARHVYAHPGAEADVLAAWREVLGSRAWGAAREEAIKENGCGPVDPAMIARIGDVIAAPAGNWGIVTTEAEPRESALIGMHGSLVPADQLIPLLSLAVS